MEPGPEHAGAGGSGCRDHWHQNDPVSPLYQARLRDEKNGGLSRPGDGIHVQHSRAYQPLVVLAIGLARRSEGKSN